MEQSSSPAVLFPPPTFSFSPSSLFYDAKVKDEENERQSRRRFNKTLWEYMQKIVIPSLKLQYRQFNYTGRIFNFPLFIDPKIMPKAHKIYKCPKCLMQTLKPFLIFKRYIQPINLFILVILINNNNNNKNTIKTMIVK